MGVNRSDLIEKAVAKHGYGEGALIPVLQAIQLEEGFLSEESIQEVSKRLNLPVSRVYGVATFYSQFRLHKCGRHSIKVCHGTACHVAGADSITEALKEELGVDEGETTSDEKFTLGSVACLGCCSLAPVMMIDDKTYGRLSADKAKRVIKQHERHEQN